jgi:hypothetical protein
LSDQFGDLERCALRPGNVHSADGWKDALSPVVAGYRGKVARLYFRADAAFAMPEVYEFPEAEGMKYTVRLPAKRVLQDKIGYLLTRPVGRPLNEVRRFHSSFSYQAQSWKKSRRVIAKVEWYPGELYPLRVIPQMLIELESKFSRSQIRRYFLRDSCSKPDARSWRRSIK